MALVKQVNLDHRTMWRCPVLANCLPEILHASFSLFLKFLHFSEYDTCPTHRFLISLFVAQILCGYFGLQFWVFEEKFLWKIVLLHFHQRENAILYKPLLFRSLVFSAPPSNKCVSSWVLKVHFFRSLSKSGFTSVRLLIFFCK